MTRLLFAAILGFSTLAPEAPAPRDGDEWVLTMNVFGNELHSRMSLRIEKGKVSGWIYEGKRLPLTGTSDANGIRFETKDGEEKTVYTGRIAGDEI